MLLQVNDQSLRLLDMESQVPRREEGAGWFCQAGGGSDPGALSLSVEPEGGEQRPGGPGRAGVRGAPPTGPRPSRQSPPGLDQGGRVVWTSPVPAASLRRSLLGRVCGVKATGQASQPVSVAPPP